jgi:hypothetical protein
MKLLQLQADGTGLLMLFVYQLLGADSVPGRGCQGP